VSVAGDTPVVKVTREFSVNRAAYHCILVFMKLGTSGTSSSGDLSVVPAPPDLVDRAEALVKKFPRCFWFWRSDARIRTLEDVRLVIRNLREYGDQTAWWDAQDLYQCLLPLSKSKS